MSFLRYYLLKIKANIQYTIKHTKRVSRRSHEFLLLIIGAALVSTFGLIFSKLADLAMELNHNLTDWQPWLAWILLPFGLPLILWLTQRFSPYNSGGGIPQVIAAIHLPHGKYKTQLVNLGQTLLKIPLVCLSILCGASVGREGPTVQVGAAVIVAWGKWCKKHNYAFSGLQENNLLAIGGAGGIAAAFHAPLTGVIFAIEELGRGKALRWEKQILIGVVAAGLFSFSITKTTQFFPSFGTHENVTNNLLWVVICAVICGISGGLFARLCSRGFIAYIPNKCRHLVKNHPFIVVGLLGVLLAIIGQLSHGETYGSGYQLTIAGLKGSNDLNMEGLTFAKWLASILSNWTQIPGGIFMPCLSIGATIGQSLSQLSWINAPIDFLVLISMAAFLAAATQSPLTASVVVMELTGSQDVLFWMLVCSIIASLISKRFSPKPYYLLLSARFVNKMKEKQQQEYHDMIEEVENHQAKGGNSHSFR